MISSLELRSLTENNNDVRKITAVKEKSESEELVFNGLLVPETELLQL